MNKEEAKQLYSSRLKDYIDTSNHIEPSYVPVMGYFLTWAVGYAGKLLSDVLADPDSISEVFRKSYDDVYADLNWGGITTPLPALEMLGSDAFFISENGYTIQHRQNSCMEASEYERLTDEGEKFLIDTLGKRKFPNLRDGKENARKALTETMLYLDKFNKGTAKYGKMLKEEFGVVQLSDGGKVYPPLDVMFDRIRGFSETLTDLRRNRQRLIDALKVLDPIYRPLTYSAGTGDTYACSTLHVPAYLNNRDFAEILWPELKDYVMEVYNRGSKTVLFLEGKWNRFFEIMTDSLPKDSILCCLDGDNALEANEMIGDHFTVIGCLKTSDLKYQSKQFCLDKTREMLDTCAPGGGFMFNPVDNGLISTDDVDTKNLIAVCEFAHEYGRY